MQWIPAKEILYVRTMSPQDVYVLAVLDFENLCSRSETPDSHSRPRLTKHESKNENHKERGHKRSRTTRTSTSCRTLVRIRVPRTGGSDRYGSVKIDKRLFQLKFLVSTSQKHRRLNPYPTYQRPRSSPCCQQQFSAEITFTTIASQFQNLNLFTHFRLSSLVSDSFTDLIESGYSFTGIIIQLINY